MMRHPLRKFILWLLLGIVGVIGVFILINNRLYPAAFVNGAVISMQEMDRSVGAGVAYYSKQSVYITGATSTDIASNEKFMTELRRATLEKLIEHELIRQELLRQMSQKEIDTEIGARLEQLHTTEETVAAAKTIFDLSWDDFVAVVLRPEAEKELLTKQQGEQGKTYEGWLKSAKEKGTISISPSLPEFIWKNGTVELQ